MKCSMRNAVRLRLLIGVLSLAAALPASVSPAVAQGVTTGSMAGVVLDANMMPVRDAQVIAIRCPRARPTRRHPEAAASSFRACASADRTVTVAYGGTGGTAFAPQTKEDVTVNLGVSSDLSFTVTAIAVGGSHGHRDRRSRVQLEPHWRGDLRGPGGDRPHPDAERQD